MAVSCQVVRFQKNSSGTTNATQDVTLSFTPKAIIVLSDGSTTDDAFSDHAQSIQGFSDGTNHASVAALGVDASTVGRSTGVHRNDSVFVHLDESNPLTEISRATCSFATNKVTFTWVVNDTAATYITLIAFGGTDITNAKVSTQTVGTTSAGNKDYTGLGFNVTEPNGILFTMTEGNETTANTPSNAGGRSFSVGVSSSKRFCMSNVYEDTGGVTDAWRYIRADKCLIAQYKSSGTVNYYADFVSWITDGFTVNYNIGPAASTYLFSYLVIKGGTWDAGSETTLTSTGNETTTVSVSSNTIRGMGTAIIGANFNAGTAAATHGYSGIGFSDGTNEGWVCSADRDGMATSQTARRNSATNRVLGLNSNPTATASATPFFIDADFSSFGTNQFTLTYATVQATTVDFAWWVVADGGGATLYERAVSETAISVSETLARIPLYLKPISEPSVSVSETLARIQYLIKAISDPFISVSEALERIPTYVKAISETAITTDETLTRIPLYIRPISESAITTDDSIARWISVSYTLAEPSISVSDSIQGALFYLRTISETAISVNDAVATILLAIRAMSDPSVTINDTVERIQTLLKTIAEDAISVNESLVRIPTYVKSISESAITTNDAIATLLAAVRTIAEPSISVNDTIERIQTILKQISESAISVNDSILGAKLLTGLIIESRVKWYYSLLTRKIVG